MIIMTMTILMVRSTQVVALNVTKPQHPLEDAAESKLK